MRLTALFGVGLLLCVSGCASIPTSGPIDEGERVRAQVDEPLIRVIPRPPVQGLKPEEIVTRFLAASASFQDDHEVARQYLTPEAAEVWNPNARVSVFSDANDLTMEQQGKLVKVQGRRIALIGPDGALNPRPNTVFVDKFVVERVGEEWRIADLPNGLLLSATDVESLFRSYALNFLAPGLDRLVPDPVFVPVGQQGVATSLVRSLLDGPTRWLAPAVETAVPAGTSLEVDSVPIENGVAQVDLTANVLDADDATLERFAAQVVWTLSELPDVTGVRIMVAGAPLQIGDAPLVQTEETWEEFNPDRLPESAAAVLIRGGAVQRLVGAKATPVSGRLGGGRLNLRSPVTSPDGLVLSALSEAGDRVYVQHGSLAPDFDTVAEGGNFSRPSIDATGAVWFMDRFGRSGPRSVVWRKPVGGELVEVRCPELRKRKVMEMRVSLDGTRAAVVVDSRSGQGRLLLGRIVRTDERVSLQALRPLGSTIDDIRDVSWQTASSLVVLGQDRGSVLQLYEIGVNQLNEIAANGANDNVAGPILQGMTSVTAAPGFDLLATRRGSGKVWVDVGSTWEKLVTGADPAYPG